MNFLGKIFGSVATQPIEAIGNVFDKLFTSDEERLQAQAVLDKLAQHPGELQVELNKVEAAHRSVFVAGWRPYIGWVLGTALAFYYLPQFAIASILWANMCLIKQELLPYPISDISGLTQLVYGLLGLAGLRTVEKLQGRSK